MKLLICTYRVSNRLGQIFSLNLQGWRSDAIASSWAFVYFPLLLHLSQAWLGAWHFGLLHCFYSSFHNRVDLIMEPAFYWVFYFPNLSLFVSSYVKMKKFCLFKFNSLAILWPPCVTFWGWASYWFTPFTVFSLGLLFCFSRYIVHLWCTSEGGGG